MCDDSAERYYHRGRPKCGQRSIVRDVICVCELIAGHEGQHDQTPAHFLLVPVEELKTYPRFESFAVTDLK